MTGRGKFGFDLSLPTGGRGSEDYSEYDYGKVFKEYAIALEPFGPSGGLLGEYRTTYKPEDFFGKKAFKELSGKNYDLRNIDLSEYGF